ncbi:MAG: aspartate aminotransferase family protein [Acidobacteriota bacterium]
MQNRINTDELYQRASQVIPGGVNSSIRNIEPRVAFARAEGATIVDVEGQEYIDYHAGFGPPLLGYGHPAVRQRLIEALGSGVEMVGVGTTPLEAELAEKIVQHVPSAENVLFCTSGTEATFHAVRVSRAVTGRRKVLKFQGCYHGWHDYLCRNILSPPERIGTRDPASAGILDEAVDNTLVATFNDGEEVRRLVSENEDDVAAIILEPIPHNIGCVMPKLEFLQGLRQLTRDKGIVLVFDEVITGFRHHLGGYQKICGVTPDLTTLGKAMANGFPMAAICGRREIMERFATRPGGDVFFAGTYNGHPLACAAALATIEVLEREPVHRHVFDLGERMRAGLKEITRELQIPSTVAGFGSVFLTYFMEGEIRNYTDLMRNDQELFVAYRRALLKEGIFKLPMNLKRNHISYAHTGAHIDRTLEACRKVLKSMTSGGAASVGERALAGSQLKSGADS